MDPDAGTSRCNRCGEALDDTTPVIRAHSGRWPYQHARPEDCPPLADEASQDGGEADDPP
jgi:hypothetical protein